MDQACNYEVMFLSKHSKKEVKRGENEEGVEYIILVKNEYEIEIRHAKNTPMAWVVHWETLWWSPTPSRSVLLCSRGLVLCFRYFSSFLRA